MADSPLSFSIDRIARALARIEAIVPPADASSSEAHVGLQHRHATLRARVQDTIDRLDAMIGPEN